MKIKRPIYWRSNVARRMFVVVVVPILLLLSPIVALCEILPELVEEVIDDARRVWRAPKQ